MKRVIADNNAIAINARTTTLAHLRWILDCMAMFAKMFPVVRFAVVEIRAHDLLTAHVATETISMISEPLSANRVLEDFATAASTVGRAKFSTSTASHHTSQDLIRSIYKTSAVRTRKAFWMISDAFSHDGLACHLIAASSALRCKEFITMLTT